MDYEGMPMDKIFVEENGAYSIDCSNAIWATDKIHEEYHKAGIHINDVDFLIENTKCMIMLEYKNASVDGASHPERFNPASDKKISVTSRKFYDSLHYLWLLDKMKPVQYIYVLEYPQGDLITRKRLRNRLKNELPFKLQESIGGGRKLIDKVDVLSISEWNLDSNYNSYPIKKIE